MVAQKDSGPHLPLRHSHLARKQVGTANTVLDDNSNVIHVGRSFKACGPSEWRARAAQISCTMIWKTAAELSKSLSALSDREPLTLLFQLLSFYRLGTYSGQLTHPATTTFTHGGWILLSLISETPLGWVLHDRDLWVSYVLYVCDFSGNTAGPLYFFNSNSRI
jgi:hypothetical protein